MFPHELQATDLLSLALPQGTIAVPICRPRFAAYTGFEHASTFGGKGLIAVDGRPQFAEVAILRHFEEAGWDGRWVETYPHRKNPRLWTEWNAAGLNAQTHVPIDAGWVNAKLQAIAAANGGYFSGCWDVVAWKGNRLVFAESKKAKRDRLRETQLRWVEAALRCGCAVEDFLVVEWSSN